MIFRLRRKHPTTPDLWTGCNQKGRKRLIAVLGLSLLAGSATVDSFGTANAAEPGRQSFLSPPHAAGQKGIETHVSSFPQAFP